MKNFLEMFAVAVENGESVPSDKTLKETDHKPRNVFFYNWSEKLRASTADPRVVRWQYYENDTITLIP